MSLSLLMKAKLEVVWKPNESHYIEKLSRIFLPWQLERVSAWQGRPRRFRDKIILCKHFLMFLPLF